MNVDYIIVGLGLAGISFAEELIQNNKSFIVFENASETSSLVAGGIYNPVILKRFTPAWNAHQQMQIALPFYHQLEKKIKQQINTPFLTKKIFTSVADENNWFTACDKPVLSHYMKPNIKRDKINGINTHLGYGELTGTGWINTRILLFNYKNLLRNKNILIEKSFYHKMIKIKDNNIKYNEITAKKIVFCEGMGVVNNPFFNYLPIISAKGETIEIHAPNLKIDFQLKSTVFIFPLGNDLYKVGATFNWIDKTSIPTEEGRNELIEKLNKIITVPYTIVNQSAGIRPTVKDRRPLIGTHHLYKNLAILNGLGTRGVLIAPTVAKELYIHLENNIPLNSEININRYNKMIS